MIELVRKSSLSGGCLQTHEYTYREDAGAINDAFITACAAVADVGTATKLIRAGEANGWRFWALGRDRLLHPADEVTMWEPAETMVEQLSPVKHTFRNPTLWRVIKARESEK